MTAERTARGDVTAFAAEAAGEAPAALHFPRLDRALAWLTEIPAAVLVIVETVVLFAGVVSRYVFDRPLTWSDELAAILFLWLAMLGAVIALRRDGHMRLTAVVAVASPAWRRWWETVAAMVVAVFVLEIDDGYRVAAIGVAALLMLVIAVLRLIERSSWRHALGAIVVVLAIAALLRLAQPLLLALGNFDLLIFFVVMVAACVAIAVPIAFAFGVATLSYLALATHVPLTIVVSRMDEGMSNLVLLSVPLFVFLGLLIEMTGLARALVDFLAALLGHVRGGLSYVLLGAMYLVSGISGSKAADMAAIAPVLFPEMKRRGAAPGELVALLSSSGAMSETIPPSLVLITIGSVTGVSIAA